MKRLEGVRVKRVLGILKGEIQEGVNEVKTAGEYESCISHDHGNLSSPE